MKTFDEILVDTAPAFMIAEMGVEDVVYLKRRPEVSAGDLKKMATMGVLTGEPAELAVTGVLAKGEIQTEERAIKALVERQPPAELGTAPYGQTPMAIIYPLNDDEDGISSGELDKGLDKVRLAWPCYGDDLQERRITAIVGQDAGMLALEIR